ncbi:MAG: hypothetical protein Q9184_000248 [Pyrenodesmia sp. 2 TL-2023]
MEVLVEDLCKARRGGSNCETEQILLHQGQAERDPGDLGAITSDDSSCAPHPASGSLDHEAKLCQFEEEWKAWKEFLDYRQKIEADDKTEEQLEGGHSAETTAQVELWKAYRAYQQLEVDHAKQWVEFWQRHVEVNNDFEKYRIPWGDENCRRSIPIIPRRSAESSLASTDAAVLQCQVRPRSTISGPADLTDWPLEAATAKIPSSFSKACA